MLAQARSRGLRFVPAPFPSDLGRTFFERFDRRWELTPWMPGVADFRSNPGPHRLRNAIRPLAQFHVATHEGPESLTPATPRPKQLLPGLLDRRARFAQLFSGLVDRLRQEAGGARTPPWPRSRGSAVEPDAARARRQIANSDAMRMSGSCFNLVYATCTPSMCSSRGRKSPA